MKKTIKMISVLVCIAMVLASFAACAKTTSTQGDGTEKLKIGVIQYASHPSLDNCYEGFVDGLKQAGYTEKVEIDFQNANGKSETADIIAKNMASKNYDLIVGIATPAAVSAYSATANTAIPVVFCAVSSPIAAGLVDSLETPGSNCTGTADILDLKAQLELIRALQPEAKKIGILYTTSEANSVSHLNEIKKLAGSYGFEIIGQGIQDAADIAQAAATLSAKVDCINNFTDNKVVENLGTLLAQANAAGIPVYGSEIEQVSNGCMASMSLDYVELGRQTGKIAARVLGGEKAGEIPVAKISESYPVVNTDVLAKFNITVPAKYQDAEKITTAAQ